jgi:hypothetical protein
MGAKAGSSAEQVLPLSRRYGADNYLELGNVLSKAVHVELSVYGDGGELLSTDTYRLKGHGQLHIDVGAKLGALSSGLAVLKASGAGAIVSSNVYYYREASGRVQGVVALDGGSAYAAPSFGTYNMFLGMENYLSVANVEAVEKTLAVKVRSSQQSMPLASMGSKELFLNENSNFNLEANTLGMISLSESSLGQNIAYVFRYKPGADGNLDFVVAAKVR